MTRANTYKIIIGLGQTGISCARYLQRNGYRVAIADSRLAPPNLTQLQQEFPAVKIYLGEFDYDILAQADELVISPGVSNQEPAIAACIKAGIPVVSDIEIFARVAQAPVVAITGSNGKSTVTSLLGQMAQAAGKKVKVGGNLGTPALDLLDAEAELYVLELSSFQLDNTYSLQPAAATVLNISPDHMDRYASLQQYIASKHSIYHNCQIAVINLDDAVSYDGAALPANTIAFSALLSGDQTEQHVLLREQLPSLKIKGQHNIANALAALALGQAINLPQAAMMQALQDFPGLEHRCQWVAQINQVNWYNDSKGTNVGATQSAIEGLGADSQGKLVVILGGLGKDADFTSLRPVISQYVRTAVLIGQDAGLIEQALAGACNMIHADSMRLAVQICAQEARPHDIVLLSPACASFDMFTGFAQRGAVFTQQVQGLL